MSAPAAPVSYTHLEMRMMGSHLLDAAETARVAAGGALAVDRDVFSTAVTEMVEKNSGITRCV